MVQFIYEKGGKTKKKALKVKFIFTHCWGKKNTVHVSPLRLAARSLH